MKKSLVPVLFSALFCSTYLSAAQAADIIEPEAPVVINADETLPPPPSSDRWAGAYVGVAIGHGYLKDSAPAEGDDTIYGAFAGYNLQWGPFVAGIEASYDKADILFTDGSGIKSEAMYGARLRGGLANEFVFAYGSIGAQKGVTNLPEPFSSDTALQLGAGIDVALGKNLALGVDYTYTKYEKFAGFTFFGNTVDVETEKLLMRLSYRFN